MKSPVIFAGFFYTSFNAECGHKKTIKPDNAAKRNSIVWSFSVFNLSA